MMKLRADDPLATFLNDAIRTGDLPYLKRLLAENPGLASARISDDTRTRTPLHAATDWPVHFPNGPAVVTVLIEAGADPNASCERTSYVQTPVHCVASNDDVEVFEVLIKAGADLVALGKSIRGATPLDNAVGYRQWNVAHRLVESGARTKLWHAAALGLMARVKEYFAGDSLPSRDEVSAAFYQAYHGGQSQAAEYLLERAADINWTSACTEERTPLGTAGTDDSAIRWRPLAADLITWLISRGGKSGSQLR